ncbi:adenylyltransferase and sulfurtransferase MOCS3-like protein [Leptotrombidium deliense]|uniref:Adenylyltransferase and sulfurtransferase MOCS3-like protein n=1 Tax=Leptotrombidium deliense TaxID=299467 RepID=A0A443SHL7_9ACAR|nr:adenylyltransferase and sulfurtransferase MOCS3-like protein [Leptotrombidium deliense]
MSRLTQQEVNKYGRQLILPEIGADGQLRLKNSSILIVGCGGLGCPSSQYLVGAGVGRIGLVDNDVVEESNLHRQVIHKENNVGKPKTDSAVEFLQALNSSVAFEKFQVKINRTNAIDIVSKFDIVLDATDNAATRYLLSDVCVLTKKPLVSGAALRFDGQMTVYNYDDKTPCYRCLFPNPPPAGAVTNCNEGGVIGAVPGMIGTLQALEAIKIAAGIRPSFAGKMLLFDGLQGVFRTVKIRDRKKDCISCGENPLITKELIDYDEFCKVQCASREPSKAGLKILSPEERIYVMEYKSVLDDSLNHILIDVRPEVESPEGLQKVKELVEDSNVKNVFVMCRRGEFDLDLIRAQEEWNQIKPLPILSLESEDTQVFKKHSIQTDTVTLIECDTYFSNIDVSDLLNKIKPTVQRNRAKSILLKLLFMDGPKLPKSLVTERDRVFAIALQPFDNNNPLHFRFLVTIYRKLTSQSAVKCPRYGNHWELIGFQGTDPATDLRGVGILGIYQLLFLVLSADTERLSKDIYSLSNDTKQNFPFCVMGTNITQIALQTLRGKHLNSECISRNNVFQTFNYFYCGLFLTVLREWKSKKKTIADAGFVLKELRKVAKKDVRTIIEDVFKYNKNVQKSKAESELIEFSNIGSLL